MGERPGFAFGAQGMVIIEAPYHCTDEIDLLAKAIYRMAEDKRQMELQDLGLPPEFWQDVLLLMELERAGWQTAIEIALRLYCKVHQLEVQYVEEPGQS
jgi:hypothetical protein